MVYVSPLLFLIRCLSPGPGFLYRLPLSIKQGQSEDVPEVAIEALSSSRACDVCSDLAPVSVEASDSAWGQRFRILSNFIYVYAYSCTFPAPKDTKKILKYQEARMATQVEQVI